MTANWLRPHPRLHALFDAGLLFRRYGALVTLALLQPVPISPDIRPKILVEANITGQPQGIADRDIGGGKAAGAQRFGVRRGGLDRAQPAEEPFGVISRDLWIAGA